MLGHQAQHQLIKGTNKYNIFNNDEITTQEEVEVSTAQSMGSAFIEVAYRNSLLPKMWKREPSASPSSTSKKTISPTGS